MKDVPTFGESLAPDTINRLERAARQRYETGTLLSNQSRRLAALYFFGYAAEMCLATSYFRSWGFPPNAEIDRDLRVRHMKRARDLKLMSGDPHPIVGWAFLLQSQRILGGGLDDSDKIRLRMAIANAEIIYRYWRPELRYKVVEVGEETLRKVQTAAKWLLDNQPLL